MDELLKEIDLTPGERAFIYDISRKGADHDFIEKRKATLAFYILQKTKKMIEKLDAVVGHVARSINDINKSTLDATERKVKSNAEAAESAEKYSKRMTALTVVLAIATAGLFFVGIVDIITKFF